MKDDYRAILDAATGVTREQLEQIGRNVRTDLRQAFAEIIAKIGGEKGQELMDRLQIDIDNDSWPSPDILGDIKAHEPKLAEEVFNRSEQLNVARTKKEAEEMYASLRQQNPNVENTHSDPSFRQKMKNLGGAILRGFGTIHL